MSFNLETYLSYTDLQGSSMKLTLSEDHSAVMAVSLSWRLTEAGVPKAMLVGEDFMRPPTPSFRFSACDSGGGVVGLTASSGLLLVLPPDWSLIQRRPEPVDRWARGQISSPARREVQLLKGTPFPKGSRVDLHTTEVAKLKTTIAKLREL